MNPFDLEAAKRGEPIISREGKLRTFISHVPELEESQRVLVRDNITLITFCENGNYYGDGTRCLEDLFMAPKKRIVWVNLYTEDFRPRESICSGYVYETEEAANYAAEHTRIGGKAWPMEIEE